MRSRVLLVFLGILSFVILSPAPSSHAAQRCFTETNKCMDGRIAEFWEQNGGLAVFGFPIGPLEQTTVDGKTFTVQRFERNRLELHPENKRPYDVLLGRLGADRLGQQGRDWFAFAKSGDTGGCRVFAETGHAVCGPILKSWRSNGLQIDGKKAISEAESLALFGMPLSGLMTETLSDGKEYQVQWFERARFELHPENDGPYDVLLGLLGNEVGGGPAPAAAPQSSYVPLPVRKVEQQTFNMMGITSDNGWQYSWLVNPRFANGLADSSAKLDASLPEFVVQRFTQTNTMYDKHYNLYNFTISVTEYTNDELAQQAYDLVKPTDMYSTADHWVADTLDGCPEKGVVKSLSSLRWGVSGMLLCKNRLTLIRSEVLTYDMYSSIFIDLYGVAWVVLRKNMSW